MSFPEMVCPHEEMLGLLRSTRPGSRDERTLSKLSAWSEAFHVFPLDEIGLHDVFQNIGVREANRGDVLWLQGDDPKDYVVVHGPGRVRLFRHSNFEDFERMRRNLRSARRLPTVAELLPVASPIPDYDWRLLGERERDAGAGEGFGEAAFLRKRSRSASAVVLSTCHLLEIPGFVYDRTLAQPHARMALDLDINKYLRHHSLFRKRLLQAHQTLKPLVQAMTVRHCRLGEVLCRSGDPMSQVFFVAKGDFILSAQIDVEEESATRRRTFEVARSGSGAIIGDLEAADSNCQRHLTTAVAKTATTTVFAMARTDFLRLVDVADAASDLSQRVQLQRDFHAARALAAIRRSRLTNDDMNNVKEKKNAGNKLFASPATTTEKRPLTAGTYYEKTTRRTPSKKKHQERPATSAGGAEPQFERLQQRKKMDRILRAKLPFEPDALRAKRMEDARSAVLTLHHMPPKQCIPTPELQRLIGDALYPYASRPKTF